MSEVTQLPLNTEQAVKVNSVLTSLIKSDQENKFVFRGAVRSKLSANRRKVKPVAEDYEAERMRLVKELGSVINPDEKDPSKQKIQVTSENQENFSAQIKEMLAEPTDIVLQSISEADLAGVTPEQEEKGAKSNQIDIDLLGFLQDVGLVK